MNILLNITKNDKTTSKYFTPRKLANFVNSKAKVLINNGSRIDIKVSYEQGSDNEIKNCTLEDLFYAKEAFVNEYEKQ